MRYVGVDEIPLLVDASTFKSAVHIVADDLEDDGHLELYLQAAQEVVCDAVGIPPAPGDYEFEVAFSGGAWRRFWFPCRPVTEIKSVELSGPSAAWASQDVSDLRLIADHDEPQMLLPQGWSGFASDTDRMRITATAGTATPPKRMSQAIILLAKDWLDAGIAIEGEHASPRLTFGAHRLIRQIRYRRPRVLGCD